MSDDLLGWLRDRLADDEGSVISGECRCGDGPRRPDCPDRILVEVEAKRRLIARYRKAEEAGEAVLWTAAEYAHVMALEDAVKLAAWPYADWPGYREEWRPT